MDSVLARLRLRFHWLRYLLFRLPAESIRRHPCCLTRHPWALEVLSVLLVRRFQTRCMPQVQLECYPLSNSSAHNIESSPFQPQSLASPAPNTWPGSPGMPLPSPARPGGPPSAAAASHHSPHGASSGSTGFGGTFVSRVLPQRSWAGAVTTNLTHEAFDVLCTPSTLPGNSQV